MLLDSVAVVVRCSAVFASAVVQERCSAVHESAAAEVRCLVASAFGVAHGRCSAGPELPCSDVQADPSCCWHRCADQGSETPGKR